MVIPVEEAKKPHKLRLGPERWLTEYDSDRYFVLAWCEECDYFIIAIADQEGVMEEGSILIIRQGNEGIDEHILGLD